MDNLNQLMVDMFSLIVFASKTNEPMWRNGQVNGLLAAEMQSPKGSHVHSRANHVCEMLNFSLK